MQIRCQQCHRPFALKKDEIMQALDEMAEEDLTHYNVNCPHCRKMMRITKKSMLRYAPGWKKKEPSG
jgi:hypothetical protein